MITDQKQKEKEARLAKKKESLEKIKTDVIKRVGQQDKEQEKK